MRQLLCPLLVGREQELAVLRGAVAGARQGSGGVMLLTGGAGIGKSRLASEVAEEAARSGLVVIRGRATMAMNPPPYRPVAEALLCGVRVVGLPESAELAPYRVFLGRLVPEWRVSDPLEDSVVLVGEAVLRLLAALGGDRGCLMVLEDLHWADPETVAVIEYLADHAPSARVLCLVTCRPDATSGSTVALRALVGRRAAREVVLAPLDDDTVQAMASACLDGSPLSQDAMSVLVTAAEGVPFFVEELLAAWKAAGILSFDGSRWTVGDRAAPVVTETLSESVAMRIDMLGADASSVLGAAAVLGRRFEWPLIVPMTDLDEERVLHVLRQCVQGQLLEADPEGRAGFRFRHMLTREAVLNRLLQPERAALAGRALDALESGDGPRDEHAELVLELAEIADPERAARLLVDRGRDALGAAALETAESALGRAAALTGDDELKREATEALIEVLAAAGKLTRAVEVASGVVPAERTRIDGAARIHLSIARAAVAAERWDLAAEHVGCARRQGEAAFEAEADVLDAQVVMGARAPAEAAGLAERAFAGAEAARRPDVACEALQVLGRFDRLHDLDRARERFDRAVAIAVEHDLALHRVHALHERGTIDMLASNDIAGIEAARELAVDAGAPALTAVLDIQLAATFSVNFWVDRLEEAAVRAADSARRLGLDHLLSMALLYQATAHAERGQRDHMEESIAEALQSPAPDAGALANGWCRALLALVEDDRAKAISHLDTAEEAVRRQEAPNPWGFRGLRVLLRTVDGVEGEAGRVRVSGAMVFWMNRACLDLTDAVISGRAGDAAQAEEAFRRGDEGFVPSPWLRQLARRHVAEAALRDGWGEPVAWLRSAADFFGDHGYERLRAGCRSLLRAAGEPVPRRGRGSSAVPDELRALGVTSREVDVLVLVAERLGNTEIGRRLYLSPRTVEKHVASLLAKTGAPDRRTLGHYGVQVLRS